MASQKFRSCYWFGVGVCSVLQVDHFVHVSYCRPTHRSSPHLTLAFWQCVVPSYVRRFSLVLLVELLSMCRTFAWVVGGGRFFMLLYGRPRLTQSLKITTSVRHERLKRPFPTQHEGGGWVVQTSTNNTQTHTAERRYHITSYGVRPTLGSAVHEVQTHVHA